MPDHAPGERDALGLPAGHLPAAVMLHALEAEPAEPGPGLLHRLLPAHPAEQQRDTDQFQWDRTLKSCGARIRRGEEFYFT